MSDHKKRTLDLGERSDSESKKSRAELPAHQCSEVENDRCFSI